MLEKEGRAERLSDLALSIEVSIRKANHNLSCLKKELALVARILQALIPGQGLEIGQNWHNRHSVRKLSPIRGKCWL